MGPTRQQRDVVTSLQRFQYTLNWRYSKHKTIISKGSYTNSAEFNLMIWLNKMKFSVAIHLYVRKGTAKPRLAFEVNPGIDMQRNRSRLYNIIKVYEWRVDNTCKLNTKIKKLKVAHLVGFVL
jgi:hypothetical protein